MKPQAASLEQVQRWMQSVIMHSGELEEALASPEAQQHLAVSPQKLASVVRPSAALTSQERLEIYINAYFERLLECLREEFPVTRVTLGDELFHGVAFGYLRRHPSRSYTLNQLGAEFPSYLADSRLHAHAEPEGACESWSDFVIELATLERSMREVFDGPGIEGQPTLDLVELSQLAPDDWARLRLIPAPCLRLHRYEHPVAAYWTFVRQGGEPPAIERGLCCLAIHRRDYVIERHESSPAAFAVLAGLIEGESLGDALARTAGAGEGGRISGEDVSGWFADWAARGFFMAVQPSPQRF